MAAFLMPRISQTTQAMPPAAQSFLRQNCLACHSKTSASGGLNLTTAFRPNDANNFNLWVKVYDRVSAGEMPPKAFPQPAAACAKKLSRGARPASDRGR